MTTAWIFAHYGWHAGMVRWVAGWLRWMHTD